MKLNNLTNEQLYRLHRRIDDKIYKRSLDVFSDEGWRLIKIRDKVSLIHNKRYA